MAISALQWCVKILANMCHTYVVYAWDKDMWDRRNEHLILKGTTGEGTMGKGDKRGVTQRSDGVLFYGLILHF
ncbi:hypothetical protein DBV15_04915 [Temnothorax longispinosus]|uniref:Uncharacterized protein n=1 Tax=Temnothorax longispinosus TaxID=300112 RepID=A0A4S2KUJ2_9HYME|nr:hypothetical protein DBV15_04915 [Temnothorax longispinosus]